MRAPLGVVLARISSRWREAILLVKPDTVVRWHRGLARWWSGSRWERCCWIRYCDEGARTVLRRCRLSGSFGVGADVALDPVISERGRASGVDTSGSGSRTWGLGRVPFTIVCIALGGVVGVAARIGGSMLLFPSSNIAPAYGILLGGPIGRMAGLIFGALRRP